MQLRVWIAVCQATTNCSEVICQQWNDCILSPNSTNSTVDHIALTQLYRIHVICCIFMLVLLMSVFCFNGESCPFAIGVPFHIAADPG